MEQKRRGSVLLRILLCLVLVAGGVLGMKKLKSRKKPPAQVEQQERALPVQVILAQASAAPVIISGYGEIISRSVITLPAEVSGRITSTHKDLHIGSIVNKGDTLYTINEQDFRLDLKTAKARLTSLSRDLELARREFQRISDLYQKNKVGTQSIVEKGEQSVNAIRSQIIQVEQSIARAKLQLSRCVIRAPFTGRITELYAEKDEYVTPGKNLLTLSDDSDLEVHVPLDSRDAVEWLPFASRSNDKSPDAAKLSWFGRPEESSCAITWTENSKASSKGQLDRVVRFDPKTRSLTVAIRLQPEPTAAPTTAIPLVQGMFCRVDIQGKALERVFLLPRSAVSFEQTVYVVQEGRLRTREVEVARVEGSTAFITKGLEEGDQVITTRLEHPVENSLVTILSQEADQ